MSEFSTDHMTAPPPGGNLPEMTVSELSTALKRVVEGNFDLRDVLGALDLFDVSELVVEALLARRGHGESVFGHN